MLDHPGIPTVSLPERFMNICLDLVETLWIIFILTGRMKEEKMKFGRKGEELFFLMVKYEYILFLKHYVYYILYIKNAK